MQLFAPVSRKIVTATATSTISAQSPSPAAASSVRGMRCFSLSAASISRELMLVKVKYNRNNRRDIMEICNILKAQIVDMSKYQMMIQICDVPDRVQLFLKMLNSISIVEVARTGTVALQKCHDQEN